MRDTSLNAKNYQSRFEFFIGSYVIIVCMYSLLGSLFNFMRYGSHMQISKYTNMSSLLHKANYKLFRKLEWSVVTQVVVLNNSVFCIIVSFAQIFTIDVSR